MSETVAQPTPGNTYTSSDDGYTIQSNNRSADQIREGLESLPKAPLKIKPIPDKPEEKKAEPPDASTAASVLGKEGGKAAAKARKKAEREAKAQEEADAPEQAEAKPEAPEPRQAAEDEPDDAEGIENPKIKDRILRAARKEAEAKRLAAEAERRAQSLERILADLSSRRSERAEPQEQRPQGQERERPPFKPDDFEDYEQYLDARDEWKRQQWEAQSQERAAVHAYSAQLDNAVRGYNSRIQEAFGNEFETRISEDVRELRPSFVLREGEQVTALTIVADEIVSSEQAAGLMVYLSEHPDVFQRLATLPSPQAVQREMAKIEARVEAATAGTPAPTQAAVSKARPPVRPVTSAPPADTDYSDDMSYDEHVKYMNGREKRLRR